MPDPNTCPKCRATLPEDAPAGVCPKCLMLAALDDSHESHDPADGSAFAATTPQPGGFAPPTPDQLAPHFPSLEIIELLGHGGMGAVYKARQTKLDRFVALKIIRPESADDPAFAERFNREARTLARLNHSHIVAVHDFGEVRAASGGRQSPDHTDQPPGTLYYFVMEYVDGANLRQLIQAGDLPADQALAIVPQICDALQFAHDEGIVHRDIKPENILVDQRGRVKIADFGLAKLATPSDHDFTLTGTHQVMGTPRYMAPEQMEGSHAVDHRADIYSLGVVFYEMLTGQVPAGHFDPPSKKKKIDDRLDQVVMRALAHDPARRYQQASEISSHVNAIRGVTSDLDSTPAAQSSRSAFPDPLPGPSTILDRAISRIVGGVRRGDVQRSLTSPSAVGFASIVLCIAGVVSIFIPWAFNRGVVDDSIDRWIYAYDNSWGLLAGIVFFALGLTLFAGSPPDRRPRWRPWALLLSGAVLLGLLLLFRGNMMKGGIVPDASFYTAFGVSVGLMLMGAWDFRCLLSQQIDFNAANAPVTDPVDDEYSSNVGGRDWVTLTKAQVEADDLPEVCIVCGRPTQERLNKNFSYQAEWAQVLTLIGIFCGVLPGIIVAQLTEREQRIACPVCPRHRNHWSRFVWWASTGWLIPVALAGVGGFIGWVLGGADMIAPVTAVASMAIGLIVYLVPLIRMALRRVDAEEITDTTIRLRRVSAAFAKEAGGRTPPEGDGDGPDKSDGRDEPRFSRKAILGVCWAVLFFLVAAAMVPASLVLQEDGDSYRPAVADDSPAVIDNEEEQAHTAIWVMLLMGIIGLPIALAPFGTTILGLVAISEIRHSQGRIIGLGLAFLDAVLFPMLLLYAVIFAMATLPVGHRLESELVGTLVVAAILWVPFAFLILRRAWRAVSLESDGLTSTESWTDPIRIEASPQTRHPQESSRIDEVPRLSTKALIGAILIPAFVVSISLAMFAIAGTPASFLLATVVGVPGLVIPFTTTFLGIVAIHDIRQSEGRITGLPLAVADAVVFPLLLINGAMFGLFLYFFYAGIEMNVAMSMFLAVGQTALIGGWLSSDVVKRVWRAVSPSESVGHAEAERTVDSSMADEGSSLASGKSSADEEPDSPFRFDSVWSFTPRGKSSGDEEPRAPQSHRSPARSLMQYVLMLGLLIGGSWLMYFFMTSGTTARRSSDQRTNSSLQNGPAAERIIAPSGVNMIRYASKGDMDTVKQLLDDGADVNAVASDGESALMKMAAAGNLRLVAMLLLRGANEQQRDSRGRTPLMHAAEAGQAEVVTLLLELKSLHIDEALQFRLTRLDSDPPDDLDFSKMRFDAGPTLQDDRGENALMKAAARGQLECTLALIRETPFMDEDQWRDNMGRTPLMHAVRAGEGDFLKAVAEKDNWPHMIGPIRHPSMFFYPNGVRGEDYVGSRTVLEYLEAHEMNEAAAILRSQIQGMIDQCTQIIEDSANPEESGRFLEYRAQFWQELGEAALAAADRRKVEEAAVQLPE